MAVGIEWLGSETSISAQPPGVDRTTVVSVGHFPAYVTLARKIQCSCFELPQQVALSMSPQEFWRLNKRFLDKHLAKDAVFALATSPEFARSGSWFEKELAYLQENGADLVNHEALGLAPQ